MIHALPGMGADRRMFPSPWDSLPDFVAHDWPAYQGEDSLAGFARTVVESFAIEDGDIVIGTSLGGMVACEVAKIRKLRRLILIGSAVDKSEVSRLLAFLHPLAGIAPLEWLAFSAGKIPGELPQMFAGVNPGFIRAMCAAIFRWDGLGNATVTCLRIHGSHDHIIPPPDSVDLLLDAGHLIGVTHAAECREFVSSALRTL